MAPNPTIMFMTRKFIGTIRWRKNKVHLLNIQFAVSLYMYISLYHEKCGKEETLWIINIKLLEMAKLLNWNNVSIWNLNSYTKLW